MESKNSRLFRPNITNCPFQKHTDEKTCTYVKSNHPLQTNKEIPSSIQQRLTHLSSKET